MHMEGLSAVVFLVRSRKLEEYTVTNDSTGILFYTYWYYTQLLCDFVTEIPLHSLHTWVLFGFFYLNNSVSRAAIKLPNAY